MHMQKIRNNLLGKEDPICNEKLSSHVVLNGTLTKRTNHWCLIEWPSTQFLILRYELIIEHNCR